MHVKTIVNINYRHLSEASWLIYFISGPSWTEPRPWIRSIRSEGNCVNGNSLLGCNALHVSQTNVAKQFFLSRRTNAGWMMDNYDVRSRWREWLDKRIRDVSQDGQTVGEMYLSTVAFLREKGKVLSFLEIVKIQDVSENVGTFSSRD